MAAITVNSGETAQEPPDALGEYTVRRYSTVLFGYSKIIT